ncbi:alpha,alpha-phosphotrehalase [Staphylococcus pseudintermedius]|uniref:Alpha,alpha-phosphotrehalase n=1 Tax=Staphylococcus pseudintermedius TaxID=283734 RepID=A0A317YPC9_STAPS|nr:alpha,alpha-phosphotrehalase [Staphylococcus pseudintermedius]ADV04666.1 Trehalose-6-phosphate hydrolase [Staphylococcus pseudintermedius HKU10-03]ASQ51534.1 trehalose-6-phosphate hydrolase [Staphylococcus pseudintermedius]EGQ0314346.1 alpha,alpha-phosphotrehalase [Staphylococcus pseudintermedius]EGQ0323313.1 alpha,alpha-phosphotrehalase [Staphylococcus pseudintermedius]EGQ0369708.1 alpha,alpha-phosphotrehalase [Staphylococcus pseudintermedius]
MVRQDWKKSVVYQIYPKSFNDTTGNGEGDLKGIIEKLDYLQFLGVDYLWLTPIYDSPMNDNGYDIRDYYQVNAQFGDKEDLRTLIDEAHARGLKVMLDIVINHTSTEHEWFQQAQQSVDNPYRDYYFFRRSEDGPPTNWLSKFGGNAWQYDEQTDAYYLHLFDVTQADLNWDNPEVRHALYEMINYWIDFGVDGFRFDVINLISKDTFEDSNEIGKEYYTDGPRVHDYIHEMNRHTFGDRDMMTVGEMSSTSIDHCIQYTNPERQELSSVFNFHHLKVDYRDGQKWTNQKFDLLQLKQILMEWQTKMYAGNGWNAIFWCNHDQPRVVSRFGSDATEALRQQSAKTLAIALHLLQGTPYIYQGEEIGMTDPHFQSIQQYRDVESLNAYREMREAGIDEAEILTILGQKSRDNSRTPMQWNDEAHAGFTTGTPWIEVANNYNTVNVEAAMADPESILYTYKKLIQLRHEHDIVTYGEVVPRYLDHPQLFVYERRYQGDTWLIIANMTSEKVTLPEDLDRSGSVVLQNGIIEGNELEAYATIVVAR